MQLVDIHSYSILQFLSCSSKHFIWGIYYFNNFRFYILPTLDPFYLKQKSVIHFTMKRIAYFQYIAGLYTLASKM
jgi:hypothetical protein